MKDKGRPDAGNARGTRVPLKLPIVRRKRMAAGVAGLAALLGSGAYLGTATVRGSQPASDTVEYTAQGASLPADLPSSPAARKAKATSEPTADPETGAQRVAAAREAAAKDGVKVMHPVTPDQDPARMAAAEAAKVTTTGSAKEGGTMRVVTSRGDLTGQRELAWVAGGITRHGNIECSQRFRFSNEKKPEQRDTLLVCWRTSAKRSVITVAVDMDGNPSKEKSATVIDREWRKLG